MRAEHFSFRRHVAVHPPVWQAHSELNSDREESRESRSQEEMPVLGILLVAGRAVPVLCLLHRLHLRLRPELASTIQMSRICLFTIPRRRKWRRQPRSIFDQEGPLTG